MAALFLFPLALAAQQLARVTESTSLRQDPAQSAGAVRALPIGQDVEVLGIRVNREREEWWHVEVDGEQGYVPARLLSAVDAAEAAPGSRFAQMMGLAGAAAPPDPADTQGSVFARMARSGEITQGQEQTRRYQEEQARLRAEAEERRRQEAALREQERIESERLAREAQRLREEEERMAREEREWQMRQAQIDDDELAPNMTGLIINSLQRGFQDLAQQRRATHEATMAALEQQRRQQAQQQRQQEWQQQQQEQRHRQQDMDNRRRELEAQRQRAEQAQAQQRRQAEERQRQLQTQQAQHERQRQLMAEQQSQLLARLNTQPTPTFGSGSNSGSSSTPGQAPTRPAAGNPGRKADDCVRSTSEETYTKGTYSVRFTNVCDRPIFVIWCGEGPHARGCGPHPSNPNIRYYASSVNLRPGQSNLSSMVYDRNQVKYGACDGGISFDHTTGSRADPAFRDHPNGDYTCLPTGDHLRR